MNIRIVCLVILMSFLVLGCRKEEPNPEIMDPVYLDLAKDLVAAKVAKEESEKALDGFRKTLVKTQTRTIERRNAEENIQKEEDKLTRLNQAVEFFEIRTERRKVETRRAYKIAFAADQPWPDPKEASAYQLNKKMSQASKNWSDRVPKFSKAAVPEGPESKPAEKAGEGAEGPAAPPSATHGGTKEGIHHN